MGKGYRFRAHTGKVKSQIRKGRSASSNPTLSHFREMAKAERQAKLQLIAVDDRPQQVRNTRYLEQPMDSMDLGRAKRSKTGTSVVSFAKKVEEFPIESDDREEEKSVLQKVEYSVDELSLFGQFLIAPPGTVDHLIPQIGNVLNVKLTRQNNPRQKILSALRSSVHSAKETDDPTRSEFMVNFARKLIPFFFRSYCSTDELTNTTAGKQWKLQLLETMRSFVPLLPKDLVGKHVDSALKKLNSEIPMDQKWLVMDVLVVLCRGVDADSAERVITTVGPWFTIPAYQKSEQKKAYRVLVELFKRVNDPSLSGFFDRISNIMDEIVGLDAKKVAQNAWAPRLVVIRMAAAALPSVESIKSLWDVVSDQVICCMDKSHSRLTRQNAVRCFQTIVATMLEQCPDEESARIQVLDSVESGLFAYTGVTKSSNKEPLERIRAALIAMNLFAQKHLRTMNAALVNRFLNHAVVFVSDTRSPIRVVAIRLMRVFAKRLPDFMLRQYQEIILDASFNGQTADENSSSVRYANRLLFEVLIDKIGYEVLCKFASKQEGWLKFLKKLEKLRRTKKSKSHSSITNNQDEDETDKTTVISQTKSVKPDSIFYMDDNDEDDEDVRQSCAERRSSIWIREKNSDNEDDILDMLDEKSMVGRIVTKKPSDESKEDQNGDTVTMLGGFRLAKDGRMIIEEDEEADSSDDED
ncbi:RRP12-like protein [Aphelenchoides besseyi]|nr:RRP12-like protein [Aphelenchoides besseyi]